MYAAQQQQQRKANAANPYTANLVIPPYQPPQGQRTTTSTTPTDFLAGKRNEYNLTTKQVDEIYEPLEMIGKGSFGVIRKVRRRRDGAVFVRKEINYLKMNERDLKQLSEEVNILQNMESNYHIVRYYERFVDKAEYVVFIIMEYCAGGDLSALIGRNRRDNTLIPEDLVWSYLTQIVIALSDCHSETDSQNRPKQVILHRDLKPENVFLDKDNMIKLGDFGLSKAMASAAFTNTYVGTPYYMSPELINGQVYDAKSDIWALGCLLYEICAHHPPFHQAQTQPELTKLIREGKIPSLPRGYSSNLSSVIKSMLRQNPKLRPTTAQLKTLEQYKREAHTLQLVRSNALVNEKREAVERREARVAEREKALELREKQLQVAEAAFQTDRARWAQAMGHGLQPAGIVRSESLSALPTDNRVAYDGSSEDEDDVAYQRHRAHRTSAYPEMTLAFQRAVIRTASSPRAPLGERSPGNADLSMMSIDTPATYKFRHYEPQQQMQTPGGKRITTSKSMHNLQTPRQGANSPVPMDISPHLSPSKVPVAISRRRRISTAVGAATPLPPSPTKTPPLVHLNSEPAGITDAHQRPSAAARTATAPPELPPSTYQYGSEPIYDMKDQENLPSPFLKKKRSHQMISPVLAQLEPAQLKASPELTHRSSKEILAPSAENVDNNKGAPVIPSRSKRPTIARQSLANRLAVHRLTQAAEAHTKVFGGPQQTTA
ncbi:uncharacterized protein L969DRAFT_48742 [Mixia osmundae IAM 14324]|uniref:non-specific serine/threonine protein kinase n=1 Tax=Mixia osmundae (strain CBS 9802 / IAM 14324 / JCM 22182 / KY 12970) TaxID=764103 RepID=G7E3L4_MIXOS|nr:uncharacterized protein L969DRAFT_48742 [Mixia osmundae IAM 14324]KEI39409.1 hypothetical protein L969DRAFT_48742 [Mixia osmundae IAM 14324]GAA97424.1 hypothetical protein E5Q_04102 [Mixia osmundae IAM 14324]